MRRAARRLVQRVSALAPAEQKGPGLTHGNKGAEFLEMNPTQKQFSLNRAASKKQFPVIYFKTEVAENPVKE